MFDFSSEPFALGAAGAVFAMTLSVLGAALGTYYASRGLMAALNGELPQARSYTRGDESQPLLDSPAPGAGPRGALTLPEMLRAFIPAIMCAATAIYGLIIAVTLTAQMNSNHSPFTTADGFRGLGAGLITGLCCLAAAIAVGKIGEKSARSVLAGDHVVPAFVNMVFAEALGLYGLIIGLILLRRRSY